MAGKNLLNIFFMLKGASTKTEFADCIRLFYPIWSQEALLCIREALLWGPEALLWSPGCQDRLPPNSARKSCTSSGFGLFY